MSPENRVNIAKHATEFRASKARVEAGVEKPVKINKTDTAREARAIVAAVREQKAAATDAQALIEQRKMLEGITDDEIDMSVESLREEKSTGASAQEVQTGQALEDAFNKFKNK